VKVFTHLPVGQGAGGRVSPERHSGSAEKESRNRRPRETYCGVGGEAGAEAVKLEKELTPGIAGNFLLMRAENE